MPCALDLVFRLRRLYPSDNGTFVIGDGIMSTMVYPFDDVALENIKHEIATYLNNIGIDKKDRITLDDLTRYEDGKEWNKLQTMLEFEALELLLSCAHACGFIHKTPNDLRQTISEVGEENDILVSNSWEEEYSEKEWLKALKRFVTGHTYFSVRKDYIERYANSYQRH